ncbi:hypothetical protein BH09ACT8_BH09ACT8_59140 [soil metagenome]
MTTNHTDEESDRMIAEGLSAVDRMRQRIAAMEKEREEQPSRLAAARNAADAAREATVEAEPWVDNLNIIPTQSESGDLNGMASFPGIEAKEIWGSRLLFDLLGCTDNDDEINDVLGRYFTLLNGDTDHLFLIMSGALVTAADTVIPMLLKDIEDYGNNYGARVYLAEAARKSWELNINALRQAPNYEEDTDND